MLSGVSAKKADTFASAKVVHNILEYDYGLGRIRIFKSVIKKRTEAPLYQTGTGRDCISMPLSSAVPYGTGFVETIAVDDILAEKEKVCYLPACG